MTGFHATIAVPEPASCPVARASTADDTSVESVARSSPSTPDAPLIEEFTATGNGSTALSEDELGVEVRTVSSDERTDVYRFTREESTICACDVIEREGTPVSSIRAEDGALILEIRTPELESMTAIVERLQARFGTVRLRKLTEIGEESTSDLVLVDRARLTDRQREVIETAYEMGYFEYPKGANAGEVAAALGVSSSTFTEHLSAAQGKLLEAILET